jgi:hypothetical protein
MKKYDARAGHIKRCHEIAARNDALAGVVPPWVDPPYLPAFVGQEISERPLHGLPGVYRKHIEERSFERLLAMEPWGVRMLQNVAEVATVIGRFTGHLRYSAQREAAIAAILDAASQTRFPPQEHVELHNVRAWMYSVCQRVFPYAEAK